MSAQVPFIPMPSAGKAAISGIGAGGILDMLAPGDFSYRKIEDDFIGDAVAGYVDPATNGTSAAVAAAASGDGITLTTGTDDDGYAGIAAGLAFSGDKGVLFECWIEMPATITTMKIEAGLTDAVADAGAVLVKATPSATAANYAVFVYDTDDDATLAFHSAKASTGEDNIVATEGLDTLAGSDTLYLAVRIVGDNVQFWYKVGTSVIRGPESGAHGGGAGIEGASALTPWIFAQARAVSASRVLTVKKWRTIGALV